MVVGVEDLLEANGIQGKFALRSIQLCSNMNVRGVFTSDIQY